jgi:hypothetical protein
LNEKGIPTPLAATMLRAPMSRMDILTQSEIDVINKNSRLVRKYSEVLDRESAYEILNKKITQARTIAKKETLEESEKKQKNSDPSTAEMIGKSVTKVVTSATFIRGVFGILMKVFGTKKR